MSNQKTIKERIKSLPNELRTVANKFDIKTPMEAPQKIQDLKTDLFGDNFSLAKYTNEVIEVADWAFKRVDKELPDSIEGCDDYISKVEELGMIILDKIFNFKYENDKLKPSPLYQENEKVVPLGIKDTVAINKKLQEGDKNTDYLQGLVYAEHYDIVEEYEELSEWEQSLFLLYCMEKKASNTKVGKR